MKLETTITFNGSNEDQSSGLPNNMLRVMVAILASFALVFILIVVLLILRPPITTLGATVGVIGLGILFLIAITLIGQWAGSYPAVVGARPAEMATLWKAVLELVARYPVEIIQVKENTYLLRWKYADQRFTHLVGAGKINKAYELILKFEAKTHRVLAREVSRSLVLEAGGIKPSARLQYKFFSGISLMTTDYSKGYGFKIKDNQIVFDKLYDYSFNVEELKAPIISLVTTMGWEFAPRVFVN